MAERIRSDRISYGRNRDLGTNRDNRYARCNHCGFIAHLDRNPHGKDRSRVGDGVTYELELVRTSEDE